VSSRSGIHDSTSSNSNRRIHNINDCNDTDNNNTSINQDTDRSNVRSSNNNNTDLRGHPHIHEVDRPYPSSNHDNNIDSNISTLDDETGSNNTHRHCNNNHNNDVTLCTSTNSNHNMSTDLRGPTDCIHGPIDQNDSASVGNGRTAISSSVSVSCHIIPHDAAYNIDAILDS
jgi:hypothetical protein